MRIAGSLLTAALVTGCAHGTFETTQPQGTASQPAPVVQETDWDKARNQGSMEEERLRRYARMGERLQALFKSHRDPVVVLWNIDVPETDGGWESYARLTTEFTGETAGVRTKLASHLAIEFNRRVSLEARSPDHRNMIESRVTGLLLNCGANLTDLKIATLKNQSVLQKDEVYRQIKTLLDKAQVSVEVAVSESAPYHIAVRVRDLSNAKLIGYVYTTQDRVLADSNVKRIAENTDLDLTDDDKAVAAVFAAVGRALVEGYQQR